ncbi:glucose-1-phosphate thymidylyltransferase RfbA [Streptomyces sp900105245]|uniref:Glucose-1-phosphate thymidylyltransferase n=1 Tax=Streptomyces sp. 900105245 TaxID=3154379 RepID=A0ABV1ULG0_9ACTN
MRGIVLAGGAGSRLWPITMAVSKQLLPVFDKPMIYYPLTTLIAAGVQDILVITTPQDRPQFERLLGDGSRYGLHISFATQERPGGIAEAFLIGEEFIGDQPVALVLGDNMFHGAGLGRHLARYREPEGGVVFAYAVTNPGDYGVVEFDAQGRARSIEEKPARPRSRYAVPGLYFYDNDVIAMARKLTPSSRGELEISDVNQEYLARGRLTVSVLDRGTVWLDTGTFQSLAHASEYVRVVEERQGVKIGCIEEAAWLAGFVNDTQLRELAESLLKSGYGEYLLELLDRGSDNRRSFC